MRGLADDLTMFDPRGIVKALAIIMFELVSSVAAASHTPKAQRKLNVIAMIQYATHNGTAIVHSIVLPDHTEKKPKN